jgi:hypothetical protein
MAVVTKRGLPAPLTPAQLEALRPKPQSNQQSKPTAEQIAYESGIVALRGIVERIEKLEQRLQNLESEWIGRSAIK